jgi:hypothetical protein
MGSSTFKMGVGGIDLASEQPLQEAEPDDNDVSPAPEEECDDCDETEDVEEVDDTCSEEE